MQYKGKRSQWREVKWNRAGGHSFCVCVESIVERNMCFWASGAMFSCHNHSWGAPCVLIYVCCAWQDWNRQARQMFKNLLAAGMRVCLSPHLLCSPFSSCYHLQPFKLGFTNRPNNHFKVILLAFITHLQNHVFSLKLYILDFPITIKILPSWFQMAYGWLHFCIICATSLPAACPPHSSSASLNGDTVLVHATQLFNW